MDGRKLTVERNLPVDTLWIIRDEGAWCAAVEREADAHLFVQADALKRDNARMVEALREIAEAHLPDQPAADGRTERDWAMMHIGKLRHWALNAINRLEVREDG